MSGPTLERGNDCLLVKANIIVLLFFLSLAKPQSMITRPYLFRDRLVNGPETHSKRKCLDNKNGLYSRVQMASNTSRSYLCNPSHKRCPTTFKNSIYSTFSAPASLKAVMLLGAVCPGVRLDSSLQFPSSWWLGSSFDANPQAISLFRRDFPVPSLSIMLRNLWAGGRRRTWGVVNN